MSLYKEFIRDNVIVFGGHVLLYARGIILLPIMINYFGVASYGTYSLLMTLITVIYGISSMGVGFKFQRFMPSATERTRRQELFYSQALFRGSILIVLSIVFLAAYDAINRIFLKNEVEYSSWLGVGLLLATYLFGQATDYFRYTGRMKYFALGTAANPYLLIVLVILGALFLKRNDVNFLLLSSALSMVAVCLPMIVVIVREIGLRMFTYPMNEIFSDMRLGFPIMLSFLIDFLLAGSERFVIGFFLSATFVGYYAPAYTLASMVVIFPKVIGVVLPPLLSKAVDTGNAATAKTLIDKATKIFLFLIIPFGFATVILAKPILQLLANAKIADSVSILVPVFVLGFVFYGLNIVLAHGIAFVKLQTKLILYSNAVAGISSLVLNIIFMYLYRSLIVVAIVSSLSFFLSFLLLYTRTLNVMKMEFDILFIFKTVVASSIMMGIIYLVSNLEAGEILKLVLAVAAGSVVYLIATFLLKSFNSEEVNFVREYLNQFAGWNSKKNCV